MRNANWSEARLRFDAGPGVRGEAELDDADRLLPRAARAGARVPLSRSVRPQLERHDRRRRRATDQVLGIGDGATRPASRWSKHYGDGRDAADHPAGRRAACGWRSTASSRSAAGRWSRGAGRSSTTPPARGAAVHAGFLFDVPVRFAEDRLDINRATFAAGEAPSVPLIEVREG